MHSILPQSDLPDIRPQHLAARLWAGLARSLTAIVDQPIMVRHPVAGLRFRLRGISDRRFWLFARRRHRGALAAMQALIKHGDTVFDVGGRTGFFALTAARHVGGDGQVHVFEPCPMRRRSLTQNLAAWPNTTVIKTAASDKIGKMAFPLPATARRGAATQAVHTVTLDSYTRQHGLYPQFLRIEAGADTYRVLQGATDLLGRVPAMMICMRAQDDRVTELLVAAGYVLQPLIGGCFTGKSDGSQTILATR